MLMVRMMRIEDGQGDEDDDDQDGAFLGSGW